MQWGPETDAKLFMHVMAISKVKLDYQALAVAMGDDCTPKAIMHRMAKLRAQAAKPSTTSSPSSPDPAGPNAGKRGTPKSPRTPSTPGLSNPNAATTSPASPTGNTKNAATATIPTASANNSTPTKNTKSGAASAGTKRTAAGKAKTTKGSPLKVEIEVDNEGNEEEELKTPSKRPRNSGLGFGNTDLSTLHKDEIAGDGTV